MFLEIFDLYLVTLSY
ncbi:hypothetical protein Zm00014a_029274 [Zea mays]|uniref:Uncharacterized protein n=1 Tax=Zea mays TaxID=4577 RepID=A0A3L6EF50_MAIZE|nr:hypothetical protein Zm00014a_029274 [Zea mays]